MREEFRGVLVAYRNLYSFLSQVIPFQDSDLEKLYTYVRFLLSKLPEREHGPIYHFDDEVALKYYRLEKTSEDVPILMESGQGYVISGPVEVGTGIENDEKVELSKVIDILNERFGTQFKDSDQLFFDSIKADAVSDPALRQAAMANTMENFGYVFRETLRDLFIERMDKNEEITARFFDEPDFQDAVGKSLLESVYEQIRAEETAET